MATKLRAVVPAQPIAPPPLSLLTAAAPPPPDDNPRWITGLSYLPDGCAGAGAGDPWGADQRKTIPDGPQIVEFDPFYVWTGFKCTTMQSRNRDELRARAERLLNACTPSQVEAEFWSGAVARAITAAASQPEDESPNAYLASPGADVVGSGALAPLDALACLEDALATCSCAGRAMIHATPGVVALWVHEGALRREGQVLLTPTDNYVVPGTGYDGSGPGDPDPAPAASGSVFAYATDRVTVRLGPVEILPEEEAQAVDRSTNLEEWRAERLAAVTFDGCCHVAVEIDADRCTAGGS